MKSFFLTEFNNTASHSRLNKSIEFIQHGDTSCLLHSIAVAYYSYRFAEKFRFLSFHEKELIRGALLHDYFLYDWHIPDKNRPLHGTHHPDAAYKNAEEDFNLTELEKDIIKRHMFPLTLTPPKYRESVLVCIVDKICSIHETFKKSAYKNPQIRLALQSI